MSRRPPSELDIATSNIKWCFLGYPMLWPAFRAISIRFLMKNSIFLSLSTWMTSWFTLKIKARARRSRPISPGLFEKEWPFRQFEKMLVSLGWDSLSRIHRVSPKSANGGWKNWGSKELTLTKIDERHSSFSWVCQFLLTFHLGLQ